MSELVGRVRAVALAWGGSGLFLVAFLDSSFLPLPGITDILLIVMVTHHPHLVVPYVAGTTAGSLGGCLTMHYLGRKGGEALVHARFATGNIERAMITLQRYGVMAVLVPSLLPPPAPFKIFLLLAGAVGISATRFATAIAIGRGLRYSALGFLAVRYGVRAQTFLYDHGAQASLLAAALVAVGFGAYLWSSKARARKNR